MKLSPLTVLLAALLAADLALGAACNPPERLFESASSGSTSGGGHDEASSSSVSGSSSGSSSATGVGGASGTSSSSSGPPPCAGDPCDCDSDGEQSWECDGGDCADYDERANTKADFLLTDQPIQGPKKAGTQDFDFNCNGIVEAQIPPLLDCAGLGLGDCNGSGYIDSLGCGKSATLGHCKAGVLSCETINDQISKTQGCR